MSSRWSLNENDLRDILDGMVDGVITINDKGEILSFNKSAEVMFGYKAEEVISHNVSVLMPAPDHDSHNEYLHRYTTTEDARIIGMGRNVMALRKNGQHFPMRLSVTEYASKIEGERWFIGSCLDITLQQQQEEQLKRSSKMEALGTLTSGISHDYNNMLGVILGYTDLLADGLKDDPELLDYVTHVQQAARRGSEITRKLLSFTKIRPEKNESVNINYILKNDREMLANTLTANIQLKFELAHDLWPVHIDAGGMEDAILNISINAMQAMPEGGSLTFSTSNVDVGTLDSQVLNISKGHFVKLSITDIGIGMSRAIASHIFEPFFTTKDDKGTGLGLSQAYNFVTKSGGTIRVYSEPGQGTCFSLYFPQCDIDSNNNNGKKIQSTAKVPYTGSGTILIVDDEPSLRELHKKILSDCGYSVLCANGGERALAILEKETVDLVISDVVMPGIDGYELAHTVQSTYPDIKIQLCSGIDGVAGKTVTNDTLRKNILHKPFTAEQLLQSAARLLEKSESLECF